MRPSLSILAILALALASSVAQASGELAQYVAQPDATYQWNVIDSGELHSGSYLEIRLTSQTWRGIEWKHQLFLFRPKHIDSSRQALLYIDGGSWNAAREGGGKTNLPREAAIFTHLAETIHAPLAVVRQVPFQPLFDRREDALIAYTFDRYLDTGEADWPLLMPMVKAAVRAMDTVQAAAQERWNLPIEHFTVTGASKRGWTSWLTAASDPRVASVAPMVIDMLNIPTQIRLQHAAFGGLSDQIQDYQGIGLAERIDSDRGRELMDIVDPYNYRSKLTEPKLILLGTNDRYWPLDALSAYWDALPEPKRVLYVPNQGHKMRDLHRVVGALSALHRYSAEGEQLPVLSWAFSSSPKDLQVSVQTERKPTQVVFWSASSATADFRDAKWSSHSCRSSGGTFLCTRPLSPTPFTAGYSEVTFSDRGQQAFSLSTAVCIVDTAGAMPRPCLNNTYSALASRR